MISDLANLLINHCVTTCFYQERNRAHDSSHKKLPTEEKQACRASRLTEAIIFYILK